MSLLLFQVSKFSSGQKGDLQRNVFFCIDKYVCESACLLLHTELKWLLKGKVLFLMNELLK